VQAGHSRSRYADQSTEQIFKGHKLKVTSEESSSRTFSATWRFGLEVPHIRLRMGNRTAALCVTLLFAALHITTSNQVTSPLTPSSHLLRPDSEILTI
jgi:hypothetical protein